MNYIDYFTSHEYIFKRMVNDNVGTLSFNRNEFKPNVNTKNCNTRIQEDKLFLSTCTDNADDGKLSSKEKAKAFFGGMANHFIGFLDNTVDKIAKNPLKTVGVIGLAAGVAVAGIAAVGAPVVVGVVSALGLVFGAKDIIDGVKDIYDGVKKQKNSKTDAEAKQAFYDIGGGSGELLEGTISVVSSSFGIKYAIKNAKNGIKVVQSSEEFFKNLDDLFKGFKNSFKNSFKNVKNIFKKPQAENKAIKTCFKKRKQISKTLQYIYKEYTDYQRDTLIKRLDRIFNPNYKNTKFGLADLLPGVLPTAKRETLCASSAKFMMGTSDLIRNAKVTSGVNNLTAKYMV